METTSVPPLGSVVAPTAITDHGAQQRRKQEKKDEEHESRERQVDASHDEAPHGEVKRDEDGHIDCYG